MMTAPTTFTLAGAALLNVPIAFGASPLPVDAVIASSVALALIGAALGRLIEWSFAGTRHELIELFPAVDRDVRQAA
jgi:VIT1/CCC1 family predicted Fe2+/Mn2+ transporter